MQTSISLLTLFALVGLNGFFVAAEFALVSVRKTRMEELSAKGSGSAARVLLALRDLDRYIAGTQVGITIASLALGWIGEPALVHLIEPALGWLPGVAATTASHVIAVAVAFMLITFLHVVVGELVPKSMALQMPERVALAVALPMRLAVLLFLPLVYCLNGVGNVLLRFLGFEPAGEHHNIHSVDELEILVRQSHKAGVLDDLEQEMLQRTFRFSELTAGEVMIPRTDVIALDLSRPLEEILAQIANLIHSRIPVFDRYLDQIQGIIHVQEVLKKMIQEGNITDLRPLIRPALFVPDSMTLDRLLDTFRRERSQLAVVVDEYGGTSGLVTLEDVVEEVFGDMQDTLEAEQPEIQKSADGRFIVRGDVRLDDLQEATGWKLTDEDADTVAGYVMNRLGRVARLSDIVETPYGKIQVTDMSRVRITRVSLLPKSETHTEST